MTIRFQPPAHLTITNNQMKDFLVIFIIVYLAVIAGASLATALNTQEIAHDINSLSAKQTNQ